MYYTSDEHKYFRIVVAEWSKSNLFQLTYFPETISLGNYHLKQSKFLKSLAFLSKSIQQSEADRAALRILENIYLVPYSSKEGERRVENGMVVLENRMGNIKIKTIKQNDLRSEATDVTLYTPWPAQLYRIVPLPITVLGHSWEVLLLQPRRPPIVFSGVLNYLQ